MYRISDYSWMMEDEVRVEAYVAALRAAVGPGSVVVDLGAGVGTWALIACRLGASKVYAIEASPAIQAAKQIAAANGFAHRIELIQELSTAIDLPEKVDVIVSDLHGQQPIFQGSLHSIIDARRRFLKDGGTLIPARETLWAAIVEDVETYQECVGFWEKPFQGLDMTPGRPFATDWMYRRRFVPGQLLTEPFLYADLDYYKLSSPDVLADFILKPVRRGTAHGLHLWFDSEVSPGSSFSTAPGQPRMIFGGTFIPWPEPVVLSPGDEVRASIAFRMLTDYVWQVQTRVSGRERPTVEFNQSSVRHNLPPLNTLTQRR